MHSNVYFVECLIFYHQFYYVFYYVIVTEMLLNLKMRFIFISHISLNKFLSFMLYIINYVVFLKSLNIQFFFRRTDSSALTFLHESTKFEFNSVMADGTFVCNRPFSPPICLVCLRSNIS